MQLSWFHEAEAAGVDDPNPTSVVPASESLEASNYFIPLVENTHGGCVVLAAENFGPREGIGPQPSDSFERIHVKPLPTINLLVRHV
jgi:hypothetical protein